MPFTSLHALYHVVLAFADRLFELIFQIPDRFVDGIQIDADSDFHLMRRRRQLGVEEAEWTVNMMGIISRDLAVWLVERRQSTTLGEY